MTIFEAYNKTKKELSGAGIEDFVFEAKQIIKHITGYTNAQILLKANEKLTAFQENNLTAIIKQRLIRYPLQYIIGEWGFYGGSFKVGPGVLIPRADTETIIDVALEFLKEEQGAEVLDLCTGSGAIAITVAREKKDCFVTAVEKYDEALRYARENAKINKTENIRFILGDIFKVAGNDGKYDLILSNPPYIPPNEMEEISPEAKFEPQNALLGGEDGLDFYRAIIKNYKPFVKEEGKFIFEVGYNQAPLVREIMQSEGISDINTRCDIGGIERVIFGTVKAL